jgi:peptidoglycan/xylan/chitin deacetylase (PgdA/CDA1 family)
MDWLARSPVRQRVELTFDDGYANLLSHAAPPIDRHGLNATAFIVTGCAGERPRWLASDPMHPEAGERLLDREGARGLADRPNWTVGAHTHHHVDLIRCEPDRAAEELAMSRHWLGMAIGRPVDLVAFPYGRYSGDVLRWADKAGYRRAFGLSHRLAQKIPEDIELIERISMSPDAWMVEFKLAAWGGYDWLVPWRSWLGRLGRGRRRAEAASNVGAEPGAFAPTRSRFDQRTAA